MKTLKAKRAGKAILALPEPGMYVMVLRTVGNPDFGQYAPISEPEFVKGPTLSSMVQAAEDYIEKWDVGGGNWVTPEIRKDGVTVGWMSYNRRIWSGNPSSPDWKTHKEILP